MAEGIPPTPRPAPTEEHAEALRTAFAQEVTARLAPLQAAVGELAATHGLDAARIVVAHSHTLASSAVILGEDLAAYHARRCEQSLADHVDAGVDPLPDEAVQAAVTEADTLVVLLGPWLVGTGNGD